MRTSRVCPGSPDDLTFRLCRQFTHRRESGSSTSPAPSVALRLSSGTSSRPGLRDPRGGNPFGIPQLVSPRPAEHAPTGQTSTSSFHRDYLYSQTQIVSIDKNRINLGKNCGYLNFKLKNLGTSHLFKIFLTAFIIAFSPIP